MPQGAFWRRVPPPLLTASFVFIFIFHSSGLSARIQAYDCGIDESYTPSLPSPEGINPGCGRIRNRYRPRGRTRIPLRYPRQGGYSEGDPSGHRPYKTYHCSIRDTRRNGCRKRGYAGEVQEESGRRRRIVRRRGSAPREMHRRWIPHPFIRLESIAGHPPPSRQRREFDASQRMPDVHRQRVRGIAEADTRSSRSHRTEDVVWMPSNPTSFGVGCP